MYDDCLISLIVGIPGDYSTPRVRQNNQEGHLSFSRRSCSVINDSSSLNVSRSTLKNTVFSSAGSTRVRSMLERRLFALAIGVVEASVDGCGVWVCVVMTRGGCLSGGVRCAERLGIDCFGRSVKLGVSPG